MMPKVKPKSVIYDRSSCDSRNELSTATGNGHDRPHPGRLLINAVLCYHRLK
jgi:hypothetical protein